MQKICEKLKQHRYLSKSKCLLINPMAFKMFLPTFYIFHHIRFRPGYLNWTTIETFFSVKENVNLKDDWTFFRNVTNIYAIFYIFHRDLNQWNAKNQLNSSDTIHHIINNNCSNIVIAQQLIFKKKKKMSLKSDKQMTSTVSFPSDIIPIFCILCIADLFIAITELCNSCKI